MSSKRKARIVRGRIIVYLIASLLLCLLLLGIAAVYVFISAKLPSLSFPVEYTVYYGDESYYKDSMASSDEEEQDDYKDEMEEVSYKFGQFTDNDTVYVNFSALADYCGFYVSGNSSSLRYILPASDGSVDSQFTARADSNAVELNGTTVHLSSPAVVADEKLYLPIEFLDLYVQGITVISEEDGVYLLLCSSDAEFYLTASPQRPDEPIDRSALDDLTY